MNWATLSAKRKVGVVALGIVIVLTLAVWVASMVLRPSYPSPAQQTAAAKAQMVLSVGAKAYTARCAYCHDKGFGPSIAGRGLDAATLSSVVRNGPGNMPAFPATQVSDVDIAAIATYANALPRVEIKP